MKVLAACAGFKDTFKPSEINTHLENLLTDHTVLKMSVADGGEYTLDVFEERINSKRIYVDNVIHADSTNKTAFYLEITPDMAVVEASQVLRVNPWKRSKIDPLYMTSYGLGQLLKDATDRYKNVYLGLGGTSTADCGIGAMQAMGFRFNRPPKKSLYSADDLCEDLEILPQRRKILQTLNDATSSINQMDTPLENKTKHGGNSLELWDKIKSFARYENHDAEFLGVAGGMHIALERGFHVKKVLGSELLSDLLHWEDCVKWADVVITGEGKLDNTFQGKGPSVICDLAKKHNKRVIYITADLPTTGHFDPDILMCVLNSYDDDLSETKKKTIDALKLVPPGVYK